MKFDSVKHLAFLIQNFENNVYSTIYNTWEYTLKNEWHIWLRLFIIVIVL